MKKIMLTSLIFAATIASAQSLKKNPVVTKEIFGFQITSYIVDLTDSLKTVQIELPAGMSIPLNQVAMLKGNYGNENKDTSNIGWGKCSLIKGNYYYFGIHLNDKQKLPAENDLLYTYFNYPAKYKGRFYKLLKNSIYLQYVNEMIPYDFGTAEKLTAATEKQLIDSLVADIRYTGKMMQQQNDDQEQTISSGFYNGKKIFVTMQTITSRDVNNFLDYIIARPTKYAGNMWKVSEIFATWMAGGAPTVIKN